VIRSLLFVSIAAAIAAARPQAALAEPIRAVILTGENNHDCLAGRDAGMRRMSRSQV